MRLHYTGLPPAQPIVIPATAAPGVVVAVGGGGLYVGHAIEETTGAAAARVVVGDGNVSGVQTPFAPLTLSQGESRCDYWPSGGVMFEQGLTFQVTVGTVGGVLYVVLLDPDKLAALEAFEIASS